MKITKQTHFALLPWRTARRPGARPTQHGVPFLAPAARKGLRALPGDAPLAVAEHSSVEISPDNPRKNLTLPSPFHFFIVINNAEPPGRACNGEQKDLHKLFSINKMQSIFKPRRFRRPPSSPGPPALVTALFRPCYSLFFSSHWNSFPWPLTNYSSVP